MKNHLLVKVYNRRAISVEEILDEIGEYADRLKPLVADTSLVLNNALDEGQTVLFEGAQATMLDVDHGTYPFVTSSNPIAGGVGAGAGIGPMRIDRVIGVIKAFTTRVGSGPFPTELLDADGDTLRTVGKEFGTTTGRPRRCGWYDSVIARYAARVNGLTEFFLTKLDNLGVWDEIPVCVAYEIDGERVEEMPMTQTDFHHAKPIYEMLPGWKSDISGCRTFEELPANAQAYIRRARGALRGTVLGRRGRPGPRGEHRPALSGRVGCARRPARGRSTVRRGRPRHGGPACGAATATAWAREDAGDRRWGPRARLGAGAVPRPPRDRGPRRSGQPGDGGVRHPPRRRPDGRSGRRRAGPRASAPTWSWSGPRRRWSAAWPTPCARPASPASARAPRPPQLEGSKAFAKDVMAAAGVPTAMARVCDTAEEVADALDAFGAPYVVKDDGLAAGKGVVVTDDRDEALAARRRAATAS